MRSKGDTDLIADNLSIHYSQFGFTAVINDPPAGDQALIVGPRAQGEIEPSRI